MSRRSVLISGAGITGPTLAFWLDRAGFATTVVERFSAARAEGQNVDVRGAGREVLRRMGLEDEALARTTTEEGTTFVDDRGRSVARFPAAHDDTHGLTAELEILRGELAGLLQEHTAGTTEYRFGDQIADVGETGDGVAVTFASGAEQEFDLVLLAEGVNSRTRARVFPGDPLRRLGMYCAYLTIPRSPQDDRDWRWYVALQGRGVNLRPDNTGTTRATLNFMSDTPGIDRLDREGQITVLRRVFAGAGWETDRVLDALDEAPFYLEDIAQVHQPQWSRGRVALAGDTAHCASPVSGMGTTLALTGAYVLAASLASTPDHRAAFAAYDARLRPFVDKAQKLPPGTPQVANPRTTRGRAAFFTALRVAASPVGKRVGSLASGWGNPPADQFELPDPPSSETASETTPETPPTLAGGDPSRP